MKNQILNDIISFITSEIINDPNYSLHSDTDIIYQGIIDSLGIVRLTSHLQALYHIDHIEYQDMILDNFQTVEKIVDLVIRYISAEENREVAVYYRTDSLN